MNVLTSFNPLVVVLPIAGVIVIAAIVIIVILLNRRPKPINAEDNALATFVVGESKEDFFVELPKNVSIIRFENKNDFFFYRAYGEVSNPDAQVVVSGDNKLIIVRNGVKSEVLSGGAYNIFREEDIAKTGLLKNKRELAKPVVIDLIVYNDGFSYQGFWGTIAPIPYRDPETDIPVEFKGRGSYDVRIADVNKFMQTLIGSAKGMTVFDIKERIKDTIWQVIRNKIAVCIHDLHLNYIDVVVNEANISNAIQPIISETLNDLYGVYIPIFNIVEIFIDEEKRNQVEAILQARRDELKNKKDVKEIVAELERLEDRNWEKEKYLLELEKADREKYYEVLKVLGWNNPKDAQKGRKFCPKCGTALGLDEDYCPNCGERISKELKCPHCGKPLNGASKFCPHCGNKIKKD